MVKNYTDELAGWVRKKSVTQHDRNLAELVAVRNDVLMGLAAGYQIKTIWANLREAQRIACSYETFRRFVRRECVALKAASSSAASAAPPKPDAVAEGPAVPKVSPEKPAQLAGFVFNPIPRKEDLL